MDCDGIAPTATACIWPDSAHIDDYPHDPDEGIDCDGLPPTPTRRPFEEALNAIVRDTEYWPIQFTLQTNGHYHADQYKAFRPTEPARRTAWSLVLRERYARRDAEEACCSDPTTPTAPAPTRQRA